MPENKARTADRVKGKNVHGRIVVLTRSKPEQLGLFQTFLPDNWLRVLDTAELAQIDQCVCQQLHPIMPLLDPFKAEQQSFKLIFPRKGALDTHPQCMDRFVEEAFASALGRLAVARILFDVGDEARIENALPIACGIKAAIEVEIGPSEIQPDLFGHLFQGL